MLVYLELGRQRASLDYRDLSSKEGGGRGKGEDEEGKEGKNEERREEEGLRGR